MIDPFRLAFVQRGLLEVGLLAIAAGVLGTWIVLRGLAFYSHAVGTAAFPGLVLADGLGFSAHLGAGGAAAAAAVALGLLARRERSGYDAKTALVLVGALAAGVILASDVFRSGSNVDTLLFGSLLVIDARDVAWAAGAGVAALAASAVLGRRWLATGFDPLTAPALGIRSAVADGVLLALVALVAVAALSAVGALLAAALLVVPAATTRLVCDRMRSWQLATVALAGVEGAGGLWLAVRLNAPPGATMAVLGGVVFALVAVLRAFPAVRRLAPLLGMLVLVGCGSSDGGRADSGSGEPVRVVATTTQLGDIAREVGGEAADVTQLLQANTDPHDYEPRPRDVQDTAEAQVVLVSGDELDSWMDEVVEQSGGDPVVVDLSESNVTRLAGDDEHHDEEAEGEHHDEQEKGHHHGDSEFDPHWWHDPRNVEAAVPVIREALTKAAPAAVDDYARNADAYLAKVKALDRGIAKCMDAVPADERKLVTDHDAFGYFAKRYGIHVIGAVIPSQTTQAQPSARDVADLSRVIREEQVKAVFPESSVNPKLARAIAEQTGASAEYTLYGDTLGPAGSEGGTYLGMERHNADAMVRGFTGGARGCEIAGN